MKKIFYLAVSFMVVAFVFITILSVHADNDRDNNKTDRLMERPKQVIKGVEKAIERLEKFSDNDFGITELQARLDNAPETLSIGPRGKIRITAGKVMAVATDTITVSVWKMNFTVHNMLDTSVRARGERKISFGDIHMGDIVDVRGVLDGTTAMFIHARDIHDRSGIIQQQNDRVSRIRAQIQELIERLNKILGKGTTPPPPVPPPAAPSPSSSDTTAPSTPTGLVASVQSTSQINLSWTASVDNVAVIAYRIERCSGVSCTDFAPIAAPAGALYSNTGLNANTTYRYRIQATDTAGNFSSYSDVASATTQAVPTADTNAPTKPTSLSAGIASASGVQINIVWFNSTDDIGVAGYKIFRCSTASCSPTTQVATTSVNSYSDMGLTASTTYGYSVAAYDAAGNVSDKSNIATATTP
ncbi:MAG: fibronectin type III domain-containing protein [Candidatus Colwellbacteria bacterium]|nr:fibronectin type III domain-containing protein [Candidatus Colwellbacteria bacterium]